MHLGTYVHMYPVPVGRISTYTGSCTHALCFGKLSILIMQMGANGVVIVCFYVLTYLILVPLSI